MDNHGTDPTMVVANKAATLLVNSALHSEDVVGHRLQVRALSETLNAKEQTVTLLALSTFVIASIHICAQIQERTVEETAFRMVPLATECVSEHQNVLRRYVYETLDMKGFPQALETLKASITNVPLTRVLAGLSEFAAALVNLTVESAFMQGDLPPGADHQLVVERTVSFIAEHLPDSDEN